MENTLNKNLRTLFAVIKSYNEYILYILVFLLYVRQELAYSVFALVWDVQGPMRAKKLGMFLYFTYFRKLFFLT